MSPKNPRLAAGRRGIEAAARGKGHGAALGLGLLAGQPWMPADQGIADADERLRRNGGTGEPA